MSLRNKVFNAASWQFASVLLQAVSQLIVLAVLARFLSPEDFGIVAYANIVLMFANVMSQGSIKPAIIQKLNIDENYIRVSFTLSVALGVFLLLFIQLFKGNISYLFNNDKLSEILAVLSFTVLFNCLSIVSDSLIEKELRFKAAMIVNALSYILGYALVGVTLALMGYGVWSIVYASVIQSILKAILVFSVSRHSIIPLVKISYVIDIARFSLASMLLWFFNYLALQGDNFIIGRWLNEKALGVYSMAFTAMDMPRRFLASIVEKVMFPVLSSAQDDAQKFRKISLTTISALNLIMFPVSCMLIIMSPDLVVVILGDKWLDAIIPLQILLLQIPIRSSVRMSDMILTSQAILFKNVTRKILYSACVLVFAWFGHYWGLIGVATGVTVAVMVNFFVSMQIALKSINVKWVDLAKVLMPGFELALITIITLYVFKAYLLTEASPFLYLIMIPVLFICLLILLIFLYPGIYGRAGNLIYEQIESKLIGKNYRVDRILSIVGNKLNKV